MLIISTTHLVTCQWCGFSYEMSLQLPTIISLFDRGCCWWWWWWLLLNFSQSTDLFSLSETCQYWYDCCLQSITSFKLILRHHLINPGIWSSMMLTASFLFSTGGRQFSFWEYLWWTSWKQTLQIWVNFSIFSNIIGWPNSTTKKLCLETINLFDYYFCSLTAFVFITYCATKILCSITFLISMTWRC